LQLEGCESYNVHLIETKLPILGNAALLSFYNRAHLKSLN